MHLAPPAELTSLTSPWSFAWWGIDLLGPFPKAARQLKYFVVSVDYSTKWIEAEPLVKITAKRNILNKAQMLHLAQLLATHPFSARRGWCTEQRRIVQTSCNIRQRLSIHVPANISPAVTLLIIS